MDKNNLIDFNNENCFKMSSPLIPAPRNSVPRLSDIANNPFDKLLKTISDKYDPFECCSNVSFGNKLSKNITGNIENIGNLISPIRTPVKSSTLKKISSSPLHISRNYVDEVKVFSSIQLLTPNLSQDCNVTDTSLHILSDSIINSADELSNSFTIAYNLPLPNTPDDEIKCSSNNNLKLDIEISSVVSHEESKNLVDSDSHITLNTAYIDNSSSENLRNKLFTKTSVTSTSISLNQNSFNVESLETGDITKHLPNISRINSNDSEKENEAFIEDISELNNFERRCLSVRNIKNNLTSVTSTSKPRNLNNSFAGFNYIDRNIKFENFGHSVNWDKNTVLLEATQLSEAFRKSTTQDDIPEDLIDDISQCTPPWEEEIIELFLEDDSTTEKNSDNIKTTDANVNIVTEVGVLELECCNSDENKSESNDIENKLEQNIKSNETDHTDVQNAKELLHNLSAILNNNGTVIDKRKLGENLINSLALALNIETPVACNNIKDNKPVNKLQRSKSDSIVSEKARHSLMKQENKLIVPKIKTRPAASVQLDKNLKVRNEKEKVTTKGPLKAIIPLTNMAKNKRNIGHKVSLPNTTPSKLSSNEGKLKSPIAQSTPDVNKYKETDINNGTPRTKRHFGYSISPLSRPASTNDISNICINTSLSPTNTSNLNQNLNKSGVNLSNHVSNSSIPTIKSLNRRNSASDISTSRSSVLNRSYDNNQPVRQPVQLKRSSSFQNKKISTTDNNTVKKYGIPGTLKALRLVPKAKKSTAD